MCGQNPTTLASGRGSRAAETCCPCLCLHAASHHTGTVLPCRPLADPGSQSHADDRRCVCMQPSTTKSCSPLQCRYHQVKSRVRQTLSSECLQPTTTLAWPEWPAMQAVHSHIQGCWAHAHDRCPVCLQPTTTLAWCRPSRWPVMQHPAHPMGPASSMMSCRMQPACACGPIWRPCRYWPLPCAAFLCAAGSACEQG